MDAVFIIIFASVYQQIENYLLSPKLSKITMDIHPAIAFGSVIVFANLFGAIGAIVAVPIAAALVALLDTYSKRYELIPELVENPKSSS
jgi:predicted PurR-regulated permease PerM